MSGYVLEPPSVVGVPVVGGGLFGVRRVFCVGRNYGDHVRELGGDPKEQPPIFFTKPADAVVTSGAPMPYPPRTADLHYEVELVVALSGGGRDIAPADAQALIYGYAVGLDMTRRDLQGQAKAAGQPWDMAKAFDHSAPIGDIVPVSVCSHPTRGAITLTRNGEIRQRGDLSEMIWSVPDIVAALSGFVALAPGDLIFTGTPSGVGPTVPGDRLIGTVEGVGDVSVSITETE
ncbi:fumarylpyruvate hydrolase [Endobacter medicaginis]|uniref:Fumarylacetoacetate hydrolase family protein n=1 Tax=Endobacter medicaginis TaxID=1181271 RepID=A0A839V6M7_9PROT|nr:fumarylacetoacetate hydrolase family protein [Endobacter medicaginis]MBB3175189.1 fumarylpyruvate hydrolase [Endobacter medicaginis]MCX5476774.1 fumarylacetoacetate hydrolase family protein [Endobacter medicaginis]NVN31011.1 fumarylacetoacetate hydrolase family protein [Endobacter medicaginis]